MAVAVDNAGQSAGAVSATSITISAFVVGSGANRCIYLGVSQWKAADTAPTAVFNGTENFVVHDSVTIAEAGGTRRVTILKLVDPTVTTANIVVSWASAVDEAVCGATSWNGVDQANPFSAAVKNSGSAAGSSSINIPNTAGDVVHDTASWDGPAGAAVGTANQTSRWKTTAATNTTEGDAQSAVGAGSTITCTWSTETNPPGFFTHIGVAIQQASGALPDTAAKAPFPRARLLLPNRPFGSCNPLREMKWNDFGAGAGGPVNTPISLDVLSTFTPAATFQSAYNRTLAVATAWTSTVARVAARSLALAVNSTFTPALQRNFSRALSVASTFVTNLVVGRAYARTVSVTSAFVAALTESAGYQRALSVTSSFVAALTRQAGHVKTLAVSGTWSVAIQRGISHTLAISSSFAVSLTRKASYQRTLAITSTYTPSLNRTAAHFCALAVASVFVVGLTVGRGFFRTLAVGSTLGVSITKLTTHTYLQALAATSTFTVSLTRTLAWRRTLAVASVYVPTLVRIATHPRTLAVASSFALVLVRGIALRLAVGSVFVTALKRGISMLLSVAPPFVAHVLQGLLEILIGFLTHIQAAFQVRAIDAQPNETTAMPSAAFEVRRSG
jgi:hypothetical protein